MEKTIKYLENGEYHYATVKDVGDLAKLKTDSKDDLVTAINELFVTGVDAPKKPEGYDKLVDNVADAIKKQQQMTDTITNMQQSAQLSDAEMEHMKQVQEELHQEYLKAIKELNEAVDKAKADAADLDKKTSDLQDKLDETFANVDKEVSDVHKQLDSESAGLRKDLNDTKTSLESTRKDLLNNTQEFGVVNSEVKELKDKMDRRIWSTDLDPVREQVNKNTTEVSQTKDELKNKADQSSLDLVTNSVENLSTQIKENAEGLKVAVKRDELGGDVARLLNDKTNLLLGTRSFSGNNWLNKSYWHEEPGYWNGLKVYSTEEQYYGIQYQYYVKAGNTYTFSLWAKQDVENTRAAFYLLAENKDGIVDPLRQENVLVKTDWTRVCITFEAIQDAFIYPRLEQTVTKNKLYVAGYKLELGKSATPWEPNESDVAENIEHNESQFNVYNDKIQSLTEKQVQQGNSQEKLRTEVIQAAEGTKQISEALKDTNGDITKLRGELQRTADHMKTEYETYTNKAVGQISDSSLNLIRNSSFQDKEDNFSQWHDISAKANIKQDANGLRWVELTQSGMTTDNPQGITSNYFNVKQGKVTIAVDIKLGDKAELDNESVLFLELYDNAKKRVDFHWVTLAELGLNKNLLNDHQVHRGLYRLAIDRTDAQYMTVKAHLMRNGDLYFTNFSARLSSIDDGAYEPNPDDINQQILKQNTKIEQNAKEVAIKANSVDVTRDIKSAVDGIQVGGINLAAGTNQEYTMGYGIPNTIWKDGFAYGTLPTTGSGNEILPQDPHMFWYTLTAGQEYTQTIWFKTDATVKDLKASGITWFTGDGHDYQPATIQRIGPNSYKMFSSYKWPGKNNNDVRLFDISELRQAFDLNTGTYLKFGKLKLEEGNKSTSWSPAPEDTSAEIKSAKDAAIQVASDQINIHVNELSTSFDDKLNKRVNEVKTASEKFTSDGIEQVVTKVTNVKNDVDRLGDKIDGIQIGGRNLLVGTSDDEKSGKAYAFADYQISGGLQPGKTYMLSGWARVDQNSLNHRQNVFIDAYSEDWSWSVSLGINASVDWQYNKLTFTTPVGKQLHPYVTVYLLHPDGGTNENNNDAISGMAFIKKLKLEEGNIATDYTHAPEDINQSIKDATECKTVTGTIDFNNLKTQQKIFYKDLQATNAPAGGNYWYYLDVEPGYDGRILQTAVSDRDNITWVRTFVDNWGPWIRQADQRNVDDLNNQINGFKTEVTASVKNLGDRVTTEVNSIETKVDGIQIGGRNLAVGTDKDIVIDDTNNKGAQGWQFATIHLAEQPKLGDQITISAEGVLTGNGHLDDYTVILYNETTTDPRSVQGRLKPGQRSSVTVKVDNINGVGNTVLLIYAGNPSDTQGKKNVIHHLKIEKGNKPTEWSLAPEDTLEAIKEVNTKWDVANGQIQGKVTATDVNNIINSKGYATQSWAQTMFQMKSDSITLQAVRDNITNGIQNQVNDTRNQVKGLQNQFNTQTGINLLKGTADFSGPWFNKNGKGWSYNGEWQPPTSENKSERNNNVVYQNSGHAWDGLGQTVELDTGEYTFSMWMWPTLSGNESMNIYAGDSQYGGTAKVNYSGYRYSASQPQNRWILVKTYLTVTQGGKLSIRPELNQASGTIHVASYMLQHGHVENPVWAPAPDDLAPKSIISSINITPDQIKIASNKIEIDGNTKIHGVLDVKQVTLQGKNGNIDLSGDSGIKIGNNVGATLDLNSNGVDIAYKNEFKMDINSSHLALMQRNAATDQKEPVTIGIFKGGYTKGDNARAFLINYNPGSATDAQLHGADFMALGYTDPNNIGSSQSQIQLISRNFTSKRGVSYRKGVKFYDDITLQPYQKINIGDDDKEPDGKWTNDQLMIHRVNWKASSQADRYQPTIRLGWDPKTLGTAGVTFLWDQLKPFGNRDISDLGDIWFNGMKFAFGYVHNNRMMGGTDQPAFMRIDPSNGSIMSGIAFAAGSTWDLGSGAWNITGAMMNAKGA